MKKFSGIIVFLLVGVVFYLVLKISLIDLFVWDVLVVLQMIGVFEFNDILMKVELFGQGQLYGFEDIVVDSQGCVYVGFVDGCVVCLDVSGKVEIFVDIGGCLLGMDFDVVGNLIFVDVWKGLLCIDLQGKVEIFVIEVDGVFFVFIDDFDIVSDGCIYFSDVFSKFYQFDYIFDLFEV